MTKPDGIIYLEMRNFPDCTDVEIKAKRSESKNRIASLFLRCYYKINNDFITQGVTHRGLEPRTR